MATDNDIIIALYACAEAELNRLLTNDEKKELIEVFNRNSSVSVEIRAKKTIQEFCEGKTYLLNESVTASDNTNRKMNDLINVLKDWKK
jgi:hypothetical protein